MTLVTPVCVEFHQRSYFHCVCI